VIHIVECVDIFSCEPHQLTDGEMYPMPASHKYVFCLLNMHLHNPLELGGIIVWLCMCRWLSQPLQSTVTSDERVWVWLLSESVSELYVCWTVWVRTPHHDQQLAVLCGQP